MASLSRGFAVGARFAAVAAAAVPLVATAEPEAGAVSYQVPAECPSATWFERHLDSQLQGRERPLGEIDVRTTHGESFVGVVDYRPANDGAAFRRELEGNDCEEVLSGLALGLALHWDTLATEESASETSALSTPGAASTTASTFTGAPMTTAAPTSETEVQAALAPPPLDEFAIEPEETTRWPLSVTAGPGWRSGTGPKLDSYGALNVELFGTGEGFSSGAYGLRLETTLTSRDQGVVFADGERWRSRWFLVAARGCPFGKRAWRELVTSLCATLSAGNYRAHVDGNPEAQAAISRLAFGPRVSLQLGQFHALFGSAWEIPLLPVQVEVAGRPVYYQHAGFSLSLEAGFTTEALQ